MNIFRMWERADEIEKMLSAVLDDYTVGVDFFKILEEHDNLIYASTNDSCYEFTLEELMLEYMMLLKLEEVKKMNIYYVTYWWKSGTSPVTFIYNSLEEATERFKEEGGTEYRVEGESLTGAYSAPEKSYEIQFGSQFIVDRG